MARLELKRKKIAHLEALVVEGEKDKGTVVLFHGFGADMSDLATLAEVLQAPKGTNWVFPNGHLKVPLGGHFEGRAWFPIALAELERSMAAGQTIDLSTVVPPGLKRSREMAFELLEKLNVPPEKLVLGGFSQGAMLATDLVMQMETRPAGLVILSGTLVNMEEWRKLGAKHKGLEYFMSHGSRDGVLAHAMAEKLHQVFKDSGWVGQLQTFNGAHEIPPEVLIQLAGYLRRKLK